MVAARQQGSSHWNDAHTQHTTHDTTHLMFEGNWALHTSYTAHTGHTGYTALQVTQRHSRIAHRGRGNESADYHEKHCDARSMIWSAMHG